MTRHLDIHSNPRRRGRAVTTVVLLVALAGLSAGCGSRLSETEIQAQNTVPGAAPVAVAANPVRGAGVADDGGEAAATDAGGSGTGPVASTGSEGATGASASGSGPAASAAGASAGSKAPITIGFVGWLSGVGGPSILPARDAWVAWSKMVNAKGGINGHPVRLLVGDDGGNQSRSVAVVRDFVENKGAIAISWYSVGVDGVANYAKSKNIPVIGSGAGEAPWLNNPMMFPPGPILDGSTWGTARLLKDAGIKRVAVVYCAESTTCQQTGQKSISSAKELGLEVVYTAQISFSQPDYTGECLQMRNANAEAVIPISENTSVVRLAQSCGRQNYHPRWNVSVVTGTQAKQVRDFEGGIAAAPNFPWFLTSGSAAVEEYASAIRTYAPNRVSDGSPPQTAGWLSAKIFEKAAARVSDQPTSQDILEGLWAMKNETFGGLAPAGLARTFTKNQPTPETFCVFEARIERGGWVAPRGLTPVCR
jgi:branched-chain amino acid transport system substrate-binding protein